MSSDGKCRVLLKNKEGRRAISAYLFDTPVEDGRFLELRPRGASSICLKLSKEEVQDFLGGKEIRKEQANSVCTFSIQKVGIRPI